MNSRPGRAKRLESAVSICLVAILFLIGVGIFLKQFDVDMSRFGIEATRHRRAKLSAQKGEKIALDSLAPSGFGTLAKTETYTTENLYEKINGKAPLYIESGFKDLLTQRFISKDRENLWMELFIYDMGNIENAYSVYSTQKRAEVEMLSFAYPRFHYKTSNGLYFVHGKYYVEAVGSSESTKLLRAMVEITQKISSVLPADSDTRTFEAKMALFPKENLVPGSIKLYLTDAFGFEGLTDTFTARYEVDSEIISVFLSKRTSTENAASVAKSYRNFLLESGGKLKKATNKALEGQVLDFYGMTEIVSSIGPFVVGIHEAENQQAAEKLAEILVSKINEVINSADNE